MRVFVCEILLFLFLSLILSEVLPVCAAEKDDAKKPFIVEEILKSIPQKNTITYTSVPRGIILSVAQEELFDGNSDTISPNGQIILQYIATLLNTFENNCTIEAHTEERLSKTGIYKEDWEISIVRANVIAHYLVEIHDIPSERVFPIGFGKIMPFKDNVSQEDFQDNRIDFVIFDYTVSR